MDFFKLLPEEVSDEIITYLNANDIKEASLVSKHWYNSIGRSKICMEKLCLKRGYFGSLQFYESVLESNRLYQNLIILTPQEEVLKNTKYLRVMRHIVNKFAESLVSIKISHDLKLESDLPKLKELEFDTINFTGRNFTSLIASNGLMTKAKCLEKLSVRCRDMDEKSMKYFKDFLSNNSSLKILKIPDYSLVRGLNADKLKFKLEQFYISYCYNFLTDPIEYDFFNAFTSSLKLMECHFRMENLVYFLSNFPKLQTLIIHCHNLFFAMAIDQELSDIPSNDTITQLVIHIGDNIENLALCTRISAFMLKLHNLQEVATDWMDAELFTAVHSCRSLKVVQYKHIFYDFFL